jgi:FkbM family methyltransferase
MRRSYTPWPLALADRLGIARRNGLWSFDVVRVEDGVRARLLARAGGHDLRTINEVWAGRAYDRHLPGWSDGRVDVVVDVGANAGYFTVLASRLAPSASIVSVEPEPENLRILRANLALNDIDASVVAAAVVVDAVPDSDKHVVVLHRSNDPRLHTIDPTVAVDPSVWGQSIVVAARTLGDLIASYVPSGATMGLKVDIEGNEWQVLSSLSDEDLARIHVIGVESDEALPASLAGRLDRSGFLLHVDRGALYGFAREGYRG